MKKWIFILIILAITLLLWARFVSTYGFDVREYAVKSTTIPSSYHGLKIVHLSDLHYGRTTNEEKLEKIVKKINYIKPDLVFITGDIIDRNTKITDSIMNTISKQLNKIDAFYGKYVVRGNHDVSYDFEKLIGQTNFINLTNSYDIIYNSNYDPIYIGGLDSEFEGSIDIKKMAKELDDGTYKGYKILLVHTPDTFQKIKKYNFDLVLSGHSHLGQVRLPFIGKIITPPYSKNYYEEHYQIEKTEFFITPGLGTSTVDFRFFNRPAFHFYRIQKI